MKKQPGVMLYFEMRKQLALLTQSEKGDLLDAILAYGQEDILPAFENDRLALIWPFIETYVQRDTARYEARRKAGLLGAQRRWGKEEPADDTPMAQDGKPMADLPPAAAPTAAAAAETPISPAAAAAPTAAAPETPAPPARRPNGTHLPDCVAMFVPPRKSTEEELARQRAECIAKLRALPEDY